MIGRLLVTVIVAICLVGAGSPKSEVRELSLTSPVRAGDYASVTVRVSPPARCTITLKYVDALNRSVVSSAKGLGSKARGRITWRWRVDSKVRPGLWPIVVRCGRSGTLRLGIQVLPNEPNPIAGQGFDYVFGDEFTIFDPGVWSRSIWYEPAAPRTDVYVKDGVLHLRSRRVDGYPMRQTTTRLSASKTRSFRRGYFEARMRWTSGKGAWPAFWLFSTNWANTAHCPPLVSELDIFEGLGTVPTKHLGTLHRNTSHPGPCSEIPDTINSNAATGDSGVDLTADFHVYAALWSRTEVIWFLDGRELKRWPLYDSTDQDMFLLFQINAWEGAWGVDSTTPAELYTDVDWVRVWQQ